MTPQYPSFIVILIIREVDSNTLLIQSDEQSYVRNGIRGKLFCGGI